MGALTDDSRHAGVDSRDDAVLHRPRHVCATSVRRSGSDSQATGRKQSDRRGVFSCARGAGLMTARARLSHGALIGHAMLLIRILLSIEARF